MEHWRRVGRYSLRESLTRSIRSTVKRWFGHPDEPEIVLERALREMQEHLFQLRQNVAGAIALQKRVERDGIRARQGEDEWYRRAQLACQKGDEDLARAALTRRKFYQDTASALEAQSKQQQETVKILRADLQTLETQIVRVKAKKEMYVARVRAARASAQLSQLLSRSHANPLLDAFDRLEERVMDLEARASAIVELETLSWEPEPTSLESTNREIDEELATLKAEMEKE
ncbi:MAG TPA: PspA/IM30 family protein [Oscillatoriales cyanobacterium M59_W2019_021]|nr:MAG: PspA/IM30 family protein [Cyanobacteria bacterium J055]HIK31928.1 PspA/IM30 family protein [Oscillatoriales cyanobacterium M4454_W2019_049]HIK52822.1 PspA/IM30 family protein [Oscillatoriales cyanobacterium M59_W2019_021]